MTYDVAEHLQAVTPLLAVFHAVCSLLNLGASQSAWRRGRRDGSLVWLGVAMSFAVLSVCSLAGRPPGLPETAKTAIDAALGPVTLFVGSLLLLAALYRGRRFLVAPAPALAMLNVSLLLFGLSLADPVFANVVLKPDHVPIVAMVYLLGFLTWVGAYQAVENDRRMADGAEPTEKMYADRVLVWPDLVYIELIAMVLLSALLIAWSLLIAAPLEEPANPAITPNPSKAPWYFLGLQELLIYADAWYVGVVVPCLITFGLIAIPYLDVNPKGNGYYTIEQRRREYLVFQFGLLMLWVLLILIGTFMRGPNWSFFGLYEARDHHKVVSQVNVALSEYFWVSWLGRPLPEADANVGFGLRAGHAIWREFPGTAFLGVYFLALPPLLGRTLLRSTRRALGTCRYWIVAWLLLLMLTLPLKMVLRWTLNISYLVSMPEFLLNF